MLKTSRYKYYFNLSHSEKKSHQKHSFSKIKTKYKFWNKGSGSKGDKCSLYHVALNTTQKETVAIKRVIKATEESVDIWLTENKVATECKSFLCIQTLGANSHLVLKNKFLHGIVYRPE